MMPSQRKAEPADGENQSPDNIVHMPRSRQTCNQHTPDVYVPKANKFLCLITAVLVGFSITASPQISDMPAPGILPRVDRASSVAV